jgi:uncharacterized protein
MDQRFEPDLKTTDVANANLKIDGRDAVPTTGDTPPVVWLLLDDRPGHQTQVRGLARTLGWAAVEKRLAFNFLNRLPNPLLGAGLLSLHRRASDALAPPWPALVVGMGRRVAPVARWIKRQSAGRSRVVLLGRKAANDPRAVDLAVSCAHFGLVRHPRLVELTLPPTQVDAAAMAAARAARTDPLAALARPRVVLLVGGPTAQHRLRADDADRMARSLAAAAAGLGGSLAVVTSRRTPKAAVEAMRAAAPAAHLHEWRADRRDNPYLSYLARADLLVVTGESESMLAEAAASGLPLTVYPLAPRPATTKDRLAGWLRRQADRSGPVGALARAVLGGGWLTPPRDLAVLHCRLSAEGLAQVFDGCLNQAPPPPRHEIANLAERIRGLLREGEGAAT